MDFNVPQNEEGKVTDNTRIVAAKPTIDKVLNDGICYTNDTSRKTKRAKRS